MDTYDNPIDHINGRLRKRIGSRDASTDARAMLRKLEQVGYAARALREVKASRSPLDTDAAHVRRVAKAAQKMAEKANANLSEAMNIYAGALATLSKDIDHQAGLRDHQYGAEMRAAFRAMSEKERAHRLDKAMKDGDSDLISAIGLAPAMLSGVDPEMAKRSVEHLRRTKAPELVQAMDDMQEAFDSIGPLEQSAQSLYNECYNEAQQQQIDEAEAKAAEADLRLAG